MGLLAQPLRHLPKLASGPAVRAVHPPFCATAPPLLGLCAAGARRDQALRCMRAWPPLDLCLAATTYAWPWVDVIARYKFQEQAGWDRPLASLMRTAPGAQDSLDAADWVLPIPLSAQRLSERGFNQSWLLARQLSPRKADAHLLLRTRDTPSQRTLPRAQRLANLAGAFALAPLRAAQLRGKRVVVVDDVMTSGASLHAAAHVLRQAGATHISALVLARTDLGGSNGQ